MFCYYTLLNSYTKAENKRLMLVTRNCASNRRTGECPYRPQSQDWRVLIFKQSGCQIVPTTAECSRILCAVRVPDTRSAVKVDQSLNALSQLFFREASSHCEVLLVNCFIIEIKMLKRGLQDDLC